MCLAAIGIEVGSGDAPWGGAATVTVLLLSGRYGDPIMILSAFRVRQPLLIAFPADVSSDMCNTAHFGTVFCLRDL